jgi:hypothetical protein
LRLDGGGLDETTREPGVYDGMEHGSSIARRGNGGLSRPRPLHARPGA